MRGPSTKDNAFTLVELLIAMAITMLIVVLLGTMFTSLASTAARANQRTDAFREARAALQMMSRDFANLVRTEWDPDPFGAGPPASAPQPRTRAVAYLAVKSISNPGSYNQELFGLIAMKNSGAGDLCSIGYYSSWDGKAYSLRRFFHNSTATYNTIAGQATYASETALYTPFAAGAAGTNPDDLLAQYVWNLKVTAYDSAGTALSYPYVCDTSATAPVKPPAVIDISFNAISQQAARTVMSVTTDPTEWDPSKGNIQNSIYQRLIKPHVYQFHTRVKL